MTQCLITGAELVDGGRWTHGDLHQIPGGAYIFNAVLNDRGETLWEYGPLFTNRRALILREGSRFFERRGVLVIPLTDATLNDAAAAYVRPSAPAGRCRHYGAVAAPDLGPLWLRCPDCGREYNVERPNDPRAGK